MEEDLPDSDTVAIINAFLEYDYKKRLGSGDNGLQDIKKHPYFKGFDWKKAKQRQVKGPIQPYIQKT